MLRIDDGTAGFDTFVDVRFLIAPRLETQLRCQLSKAHALMACGKSKQAEVAFRFVLASADVPDIAKIQIRCTLAYLISQLPGDRDGEALAGTCSQG